MTAYRRTTNKEERRESRGGIPGNPFELSAVGIPPTKKKRGRESVHTVRDNEKGGKELVSLVRASINKKRGQNDFKKKEKDFQNLIAHGCPVRGEKGRTVGKKGRANLRRQIWTPQKKEGM